MISGKEIVSMKSKETVMQEIFSELSERNKDIMILVAKSVNVAQEDSKRQYHTFAKNMKVSDCIDK